MVKVGVVGLGFMGVTHFKGWREVAGATVGAVCESNEKRLAGDWSDVQGNFGGAGGRQDLTGLATYRELANLLADETIDLVDICLPTPFHPTAVIAALEAGKHVLCEKPIALTTAEADRMLAAAERAGRQFMVAQVLRFWPEFNWLKQAHDDGRYGALTALNLRRVIAKPDWSASIANFAANGGPLVDLHIHDTDYLTYLLGRPARLFATGQDMGDYINYVAASFIYPDGPTVTAQAGAAAAKGRPFHHQFEAYFEQATAVYGAASEPAGIDPARQQTSAQVLTVYHADGSVSFPEPPAADGYVEELRHAAACVAAGTPSTVIGASSAREALALVELEAESVRSGRVVDVP